MKIHFAAGRVALLAALAGCLATPEEISSGHLEEDPPPTPPTEQQPPAATPLLEHRVFFSTDVEPTSRTTIMTDGSIVFTNQYRTMTLGRLSPEKLAELGPWVTKFSRFDWAGATAMDQTRVGAPDCGQRVTDSYHAFWTGPDGTSRVEQKLGWRLGCENFFLWSRSSVESGYVVKILDALTKLESLR